MYYKQTMKSFSVARTISTVISLCRKLTSLHTYAGIVVLLLPLVSSELDIPSGSKIQQNGGRGWGTEASGDRRRSGSTWYTSQGVNGCDWRRIVVDAPRSCARWPSRLTYDSIFNSTKYAQIQRPRPYSPVIHSQYSEETKGNEVELDYLENEKMNQLLVGFARDPFRSSIPEEDYRKGVRNVSPQTYTNKGDRGKRGVLHLYNMIYCATGCEPLAYKGYGCYCGFLGAGRPTDGIDRCCQMHDKCYENIRCPFYTVYFQPYYWKCYHNEPLCALENYHTQGQVINGCAGRLCECDRQFAMCVRRYSCPRGRALCRSSPVRLLQNILMFK